MSGRSEKAVDPCHCLIEAVGVSHGMCGSQCLAPEPVKHPDVCAECNSQDKDPDCNSNEGERRGPPPDVLLPFVAIIRIILQEAVDFLNDPLGLGAVSLRLAELQRAAGSLDDHPVIDISLVLRFFDGCSTPRSHDERFLACRQYIAESLSSGARDVFQRSFTMQEFRVWKRNAKEYEPHDCEGTAKAKTPDATKRGHRKRDSQLLGGTLIEDCCELLGRSPFVRSIPRGATYGHLVICRS